MKLTEFQVTQVKQALVTMRLIFAGLPMGAIIFFLIVMVLSLGEAWTGELTPLSAIGILVGFASMGASGVVLKLVQTRQYEGLKQSFGIADRSPHKTDQWTDQQVKSLLGMWQTTSIIRVAVIEGALFLNLVATLVDRNFLSLGIIGCLFLAMLGLFPRRHSLASLLQVDSADAKAF